MDSKWLGFKNFFVFIESVTRFASKTWNATPLETAGAAASAWPRV